MESLNVKVTVSMFHVLLFFFFLFIDGNGADHHSFNADDSSDACKLVDCGQGTCVPSNTSSLVPYECDCYPGWTKIQVGPFTFPSCVVPNCTLDFSCGGTAPPSPPPPPPPPFPPFPNFSDPCLLAWCGDGICVKNGTGYFCKCNEGSANLMDLADLPCFKECSLGADCNGIVFVPQSPPPPQGTLPPPNPSSAPPNNGQGQVPNSSITQHSLTILSLVAVAFALF